MTDTEQRWIVSAICDHCLHSDTGRAILTGAVGIATVRDAEPDRCVLCGWLFADQEVARKRSKLFPVPPGTGA